MCKLRLEKSSSLNHLDALGLFQASGHKGKGGQQGKGSDIHKAMRRTWLLRNVVGRAEGPFNVGSEEDEN